MGAGETDNSSGGPTDNQLNIRIGLLAEELKKKADKSELQHQASIMQAKVDDCNDNIGKL